MRSDTVDISIIVAVYNHEKYIEKAIQSILMQKGDYSYEVLIGEDCSTDNTRKVLKKMEPSLPAQFHIFYREKNMGAMGENNFNDLYSRSRGKYYIVLEGDDYWTYEYKLQKQFEFLESHPDYLAVAHNTEVVDENNMPLGWDYPECKHTEYTIYDFRKDLLPGQTTTILMRNYFANDLFDWHLEPSNFPGDRKKAFILVANGHIACIQQKWSAYRLVVSHGSSFSAATYNQPFNYQGTYDYFYSLYLYAMSHPVDFDVIKVTEQLYFKFLVSIMGHSRWRKNMGMKWSDFIKACSKIRYPFSTWAFVLARVATMPLHKLLSYFAGRRFDKATGLR